MGTLFLVYDFRWHAGGYYSSVFVCVDFGNSQHYAIVHWYSICNENDTKVKCNKYFTMMHVNEINLSVLLTIYTYKT